jgi:hypothetical protein
MSVLGSINNRKGISASLSQTNKPKLIRITVPGPKGDAGDAVSISELSELNDVSIDDVQNNALLQYNASSGNWEATNELIGLDIDTSQGTVSLDAGEF